MHFLPNLIVAKMPEMYIKNTPFPQWLIKKIKHLGKNLIQDPKISHTTWILTYALQ